MDDTQSVKDLDISTLDAANFPGSAKSFARIVSTKVGEAIRRNDGISSLSPTLMRVSHQPRVNGAGLQRSVMAIDQQLTRLDASSNPVSVTKFSVKFQADIPADVTLAEYQAGVKLLLGTLLGSSGANIDAIFRGEQ